MHYEPIKTGLIGYGFAGRTFHAPVIDAVPGLELAKVVERSSDNSKRRYPSIDIVRSVQELYADDDIELVVVTTPSTDHYSFVKEALLAGKHVIVEKPFTTTIEEADELIALAKERGKVLSVFHNRRWDGDYLTVSSIVKQGLLGQLSEVEMRWERYHPKASPGSWRNAGDQRGAGVFYDLGVHFFDQALCLFGSPQTITADIRKQREGASADDCFDVQLRYEGGLSVRVRSSMLVKQPGPRYVLNGTAGSFVKYGEDPQEDALKSGRTPAEPNWGAEEEARWGVLDTNLGGLRFNGRIQTIAGGYQHYFQNVADHIAGQAELVVKPEEARNAIRLIELGFQSFEEGRTVKVDF